MNHKTIIPLVTLLILSVSTIFAQSLEKGNIIISPGISLGGLGYYGGYSGFSLPLEVSAEFAFLDKEGAGVFSAGPFLGYSRFGYSTARVTFINFGVRGSWHYIPLLEKLTGNEIGGGKLDLYLSPLLGFQSSSYKTNDGSTVYTNLYGNRAVVGVAAGARYYFASKLGVYGEVGRTVFGLLSLGITLKI